VKSRLYQDRTHPEQGDEDQECAEEIGKKGDGFYDQVIFFGDYDDLIIGDRVPEFVISIIPSLHKIFSGHKTVIQLGGERIIIVISDQFIVAVNGIGIHR